MKKVSQYAIMDGFSEVKDTLEVLDFGFKTAEAVTASLADGKVNFFDLPNVLAPLTAAGAAVDNIQNVKKELTTLTPMGKSVVESFVTDRFDIPNDQVEILVEETIVAVLGVVSLGFKWSGYKKAV